MSSRISDALTPVALCLALAACGGKGDDGNAAAGAGALPAGDDRVVACALGGSTSWTRDCAIDQEEGARGKALTIRHPDGGFRRFAIVTDGRGLVPADGSEQAKISSAGTEGIEVAVGQDRYRLPATFAAPGQ